MSHDNHKVNTQVAEPWHALVLPHLLKKLTATPEGLTANEAETRLVRFGQNIIPRAPPPSWWSVLVRQFRSPLIYILAIAGIVSVAIGEWTDASFILIVLLLNAAIGGYQEWRAEKSTQALQQLLRIRAGVLRDGEVYELDAENIVPGDVVWLESGNRVPADLRLLSARGLEVNESQLTGESLAVLKDPAWLGESATPVGDRQNMLFAGSTIVRGRGQGVVVDTGPSTHVGQLAQDVMSATSGKPPLVQRLEKFTNIVSVAIAAASIIVGWHWHFSLSVQCPGDVLVCSSLSRSSGTRGASYCTHCCVGYWHCPNGSARSYRTPFSCGRGTRQLHFDRKRQDRHSYLQ